MKANIIFLGKGIYFYSALKQNFVGGTAIENEALQKSIYSTKINSSLK